MVFRDLLTDEFRGQRAVELLAERGWTSGTELARGAVLTRELRTEAFTVAFTALPPLAAVREPQQSGKFLFVLVLHGEGRIGVGDTAAISFAPGSILIADSAVPLRYASTSAATVLSAEASWKQVSLLDRTARVLPVAQSSHDLSRALVALVEPLVTGSLTSTPLQAGHFWHATSALISAIIAAEDTTTGIGSAERAHLSRATALIAKHLRDSTLSGDTLAAELGVSATYLRRVFKRAGTTPMRYLRLERARQATRILDRSVVTSRDELDAIAREHGFGSARAMREAIRLLDEID